MGVRVGHSSEEDGVEPHMGGVKSSLDDMWLGVRLNYSFSGPAFSRVSNPFTTISGD